LRIYDKDFFFFVTYLYFLADKNFPHANACGKANTIERFFKKIKIRIYLGILFAFYRIAGRAIIACRENMSGKRKSCFTKAFQ